MSSFPVRHLKWLAVATATTMVAALLWPIPGSPRWDLPVDHELLDGKSEFLTSLTIRQPVETPNILLIVADDLGKFDVSIHDHSPIATPNIDALAHRGISFDRAYATAAICAPSRAAMLTGRYQNRFGFESQPMQRYIRNLGEYLGFRYLIDTDGMRPFLIGAYPDAGQKQGQGLPSSEITLAEVFSAMGYDTAILGKWHHALNGGFIGSLA